MFLRRRSDVRVGVIVVFSRCVFVCDQALLPYVRVDQTKPACRRFAFFRENRIANSKRALPRPRMFRPRPPTELEESPNLGFPAGDQELHMVRARQETHAKQTWSLKLTVPLGGGPKAHRCRSLQGPPRYWQGRDLATAELAGHTTPAVPLSSFRLGLVQREEKKK